MPELLLTVLFLVVLFALLGTGVCIGLALMGAALVAMELFTSRPVGDAMATTIWTASSSWTLTALPLFIWMGEILFRSRLSEDMLKGLAPWTADLPGRLLHTNVIGCTIFAAVSGSSAATCATTGRMTIPELERRAYPQRIAIGSLADAGTLGLMIPPSLTMIVYGVAVNESIARLFAAGVFPGVGPGAAVHGLCCRLVGAAPRGDPSGAQLAASPAAPGQPVARPDHGADPGRAGVDLNRRRHRDRGRRPGGARCAGDRRGAARPVMVQLPGEPDGAVRTSSMIALILMGAAFLSLAMGFTGLPRALAAFIAEQELSPMALIAALTVFYIILGCFLDGISCVVLTMAIIEPMIRAAGIDLIWFGIFIVVVVEMAQITPPVGFNLFVLQGMTGRLITWIAAAAFPFFLQMVVMVALLVAFPGLATWLHGRMHGIA